jgi:hypothetical protein
MGCDIHLYVEKKDETGKWISADKWTPDPCVEEDEEPRMWVHWDDRFYRNRNYDLFTILADVRNRRGFAGCVTGTGFNPISVPRGIPEDASPEVKRESDHWDGDGHSHSWLTIAELKAYDWTQTTKHVGVVGLMEFAVFMQKGKPDSYSGDVFGGGVKHISSDEMRVKIAEYQPTISMMVDKPRNDPQRAEFEKQLWEAGGWDYFTQVSWDESYRDCCKRFHEETMPKLEALGDPDNVRIVFFFDN